MSKPKRLRVGGQKNIMKCKEQKNMEIDFGSLVRFYRTSQGLTLRQLAQQATVDYTALARAERNERRPQVETIQRLARALNAPYSELLAAAGYPVEELPALRPYLRRAYGMSETDAAEVERYITQKYGESSGPLEGEDEIDDMVA